MGGVGRVWNWSLLERFLALCTGSCVLLALECAHAALVGRLGKLLQVLFATWEPSAQWDAVLSLLLSVNYSCHVTCVQPPEPLASQTSLGRGESCPGF